MLKFHRKFSLRTRRASSRHAQKDGDERTEVSPFLEIQGQLYCSRRSNVSPGVCVNMRKPIEKCLYIPLPVLRHTCGRLPGFINGIRLRRNVIRFRLCCAHQTRSHSFTGIGITPIPHSPDGHHNIFSTTMERSSLNVLLWQNAFRSLRIWSMMLWAERSPWDAKSRQRRAGPKNSPFLFCASVMPSV